MNEISIKVKDDLSEGQTEIDDKLWEILKQYPEHTFSFISDRVEVHVTIKKQKP